MNKPDKIRMKELLEPYLPREEYSKIGIQSLAYSISQHGIQQNIGINIIPEGLKPIYGTRRLKALEYMEVETIPSPKYPILSINDIKFYDNIPEEEAYRMAIEENLRRQDMTPLEEATALSKISFRLKGFSESYLTQRKNLLSRLHPKLMNRVVYGSHNNFEDRFRLTLGKARILWNLPLEDQWYVYRYKIARGKGMTARELQAYVQSLMNKRRYLDRTTPHEDLNQRKAEAKEKFYNDIKLLDKTSLGKLKDIVEPYSIAQERSLRRLQRRINKRNDKMLFFVLCEIEGLGFLEVSLEVERLMRVIKMQEHDAFDYTYGFLSIRPSPHVDMGIDEKDKLIPYGWTMENGKMIKIGTGFKKVEIDEWLQKSPRMKLAKLLEKEEKKRKRLLNKKRKEERKITWIATKGKVYRVPDEDFTEFAKAKQLGNVVVLKKYETSEKYHGESTWHTTEKQNNRKD